MKTNTGATLLLFTFLVLFFLPAIQSAIASLLTMLRKEKLPSTRLSRATAVSDDSDAQELETVDHQYLQAPDRSIASGNNEVWGGATDILNHWDTPSANRLE